jgi:hypothetical protein
MKGIILGIIFLSLLPVTTYGAEAIVKEPVNKPAHTSSITLLNAVTSAGAGTSYWLGFLPTNHTWQVIYTGTATVVDVKLQGSMDDSNWFDLDTYDTASSPTMRHVVNKPVNYIRANLVTFTNGTTMTIKSISGSN